MTDIPDTRVLLEQAQSGSRESFDIFVHRFGPRIDALIASRLGRAQRTASGPEDVKQEALLRAFQAIQRFSWRGEESFLHWLGTIVEHVILKNQERWRYRAALSLHGELFIEQASPSKVMRREERFERLKTALDRLSPEHREVILLARIEKLPGREIARRMGRSPQAVAQLLSRALRKLRETFGDTGSLTLPDRSLGEEGTPHGSR